MSNLRNAGRKRKLKQDDEIEIYKLYKSNVAVYEILHKYEISESTYRRIIRRLRESVK